MAKKTKELQILWWDWLSTAERLQLSLHEQTGALTLRRPERVASIQPELDTMMGHMKRIDDQAAATAKRLAEELGCEPNLRSLVDALEKAEAQQVHALANRVIVAGRNVQRLLERNRKLLESEMEFVNGTLAVVAKVAEEQQGPYKNSADRAVVLVDQVA